MRIILAQPRGFCAGVERAIDVVDRALEKYGSPVYIRHQIVHNQHVLESLASKGAVFVDELNEVPRKSIAIFSAHGVARRVEEEARERDLHVLDGTCPLVTKVHDQGRRYIAQGYSLILIGHSGHPEVIGTIGQINGPVRLVQNDRDVQNLEFTSDVPLAYITQTTLSVDDTRGIIRLLKCRYPNIVGPDTNDICYATQNRQTAVRELCRHASLVLVVGARNSSNSLRLQEVAVECGARSFLIENDGDLKSEWFNNVEVVGITASASAPEAIVQDVIATLSLRGNVEVLTLPGQIERVHFPIPKELKDINL
ncbi:4-hydroxy-3-methylbut-2-enyl diphosphate reductase [Burkholderia lata]|uniref:4-hydroxy-3-methylbut-2-enyl diphosphate reductase n=1 Tax=Burkholderia lata (strain ATCC 17760 / DSM 23089 / LMG 22485 / NCIMB 9086 / R18194 / 383) TaxID=482957 RepID=UPI001453EDC6|nr:4-hydroxy-3-methylbut-2-enyl diphosphate reductase [Burkholderia lata]VWB69269.1 4-hydroxy-3-methylbut-2-enyl diphosphate reductase [Burkholderia lata]